MADWILSICEKPVHFERILNSMYWWAAASFSGQYAAVAESIVLAKYRKSESYMQCQWSLVGGMAGTFREME